jgi:hypothetical protein
VQADGRRMHVNSNNVIRGWDTDAYLLALRRPQEALEGDLDALQHCFIACGSYLRRGETVIFDSLSKADAAFSLGADEISVALRGQPLIRAVIRACRPPAQVLVNGRRYAPGTARPRS